MVEPVSGAERGYPGFGGKVGRVMATSTPWWPPAPQAPEHAPNVVVILADDLGFSDLGCYGSEISTPNLDRLAARGVRFSNFHVNPMCSPTRASLMTGRNAHAVGVGVVHGDPGFPGYAAEIAADAPTMAEVFRANGYTTLMVGKWHLTKESSNCAAGPRDAWPTQRGFDRFYGLLDAFTNLHHPHQLFEDNHAVEVDEYPDDYYLTDDLTERAIGMIRAARASRSDRPFLLYFAHAAVHAPLQAKPADMAKYAGVYDEGWDAIRARRFARQKELGLLSAEVELPPRNSAPGYEVGAWDELDTDQRRLFARYMEAYAAMVDSIDQSFGRLETALAELGELDNTLIVFLSDNGAAAEARENGTTRYLATATGESSGRLEGGRLAQDIEDTDLVGGPRVLAGYPRGWAMASNTPFRFYKVQTYAGGHQVPFLMAWARGRVVAGEVRDQYAHVTDLLPTLIDLLRLRPPEAPFDGASFRPVLGAAAAPSEHPEQYYENFGHRGYYRRGWEAVTLHRPRTPFSTEPWELYHLEADPTELHDLAGAEPGQLAALQDAWEDAAWRNRVFPLDEGTYLKRLWRPPFEEVFAEPVRLVRGTPTLERYRALQLIRTRSFVIDVDLAHRAGDEGVLVAHGDQGGGYVLYIEDGRLTFAQNGYGRMHRCQHPMPGSVTHVRVEIEAPGEWRWNIRLAVDGETVAGLEGLVMLSSMAPFEGIDVGIDRRSPVDWELYERHRSFRYSGDLRAVTYRPGAFAPDAQSLHVEELREMGARYQ